VSDELRINFRDALGSFASGEPLRGVLFLTYNLDGRWFEAVMADELFSRPVEHCLIVRDGGALRSELRSVRCVRANAGFSTRVFHSKLLLAVSERRARLCIGSANLTRGGYEKNLEMGNVFDSDAEGGARQLFRDLLSFIEGPLRQELRGSPLAALSAIETALRDVVNGAQTGFPAGPHRLLHNYETSLWEQLRRILDGKTVRRILVISPYFEGDRSFDDLAVEEPLETDDGSAFDRLFGDLELDPSVPVPVTICFQENGGRTRLPLDTVRRHQARVRLRTLDWTAEDTRPLHAKLLVIEAAKRDGDPFLLVVSGSPNFTPAAFLRTPPRGNAELAVLTRIEGPRATIDRLENLLGIKHRFLKEISLDALRGIPPELPAVLPRSTVVADVTLSAEEEELSLSFRGYLADADRVRITMWAGDAWQFVAEAPIGEDGTCKCKILNQVLVESVGGVKTLRADTLRVELYRGSERVHVEEVPLNVDCPEDFHGLDHVGPILSSLDARIAQAGAGTVMSYRDQARLLEKLRAKATQSAGPKVTKFQADLDQFFRHVHSGLRGLNERLKRSPRSSYTIEQILAKLGHWLREATKPDCALPSDECRVFLIERLADSIEQLLSDAAGKEELRSSLIGKLRELALAETMQGALAWLAERQVSLFHKQAAETLAGARARVVALERGKP
jgi:hypothetical protein